MEAEDDDSLIYLKNSMIYLKKIEWKLFQNE